MESEDPAEIPCIRLDVMKDGMLLETINLENWALFKFGGEGVQESNDTVKLFHESISVLHAALAIDKDQGLVLIDLGSKYGTCLNGQKLESNVPYPVQ